MSRDYEAVRPPRFTTAFRDGAEEIVIPAQRSWFLVAFLSFWICAWTAGGVAAAHQLMTRFEPFLAFWMCMWGVGEIFAAATICWQLTGAESLRVSNGDLEVGYRMLGFSRTRLYRASDISGLALLTMPFGGRYSQMQTPFPFGNRSGTVKFDYGARTVYIGPSLDPAEGRLILERLAKALPRRASA